MVAVANPYMPCLFSGRVQVEAGKHHRVIFSYPKNHVKPRRHSEPMDGRADSPLEVSLFLLHVAFFTGFKKVPRSWLTDC
eukprot:scaffold130184_cov13-Tisochrysis_lutea.AAC.1